MKRMIILVLIFLLLLPAAEAEIKKVELWGETYYYAEPGIYRIGEILPSGTYSVWWPGSYTTLIINYSDYAAEDGTPDLSAHFAYNCAFFSSSWPNGAHPVINVNKFGVLQILGASCSLYPVKSTY